MRHDIKSIVLMDEQNRKLYSLLASKQATSGISCPRMNVGCKKIQYLNSGSELSSRLVRETLVDCEVTVVATGGVATYNARWPDAVPRRCDLLDKLADFANCKSRLSLSKRTYHNQGN